MLDAKEGMRVIDACAGAEGKTLHLASPMKNKGKIIALETFQWKLDELKKRATRAGVNIIETREISSSKIIKRLADSADRLLLDVPCSGLGVLKRNPDIKWNISVSAIEELKKIQQDILFRYSCRVKAGGKMIYATCSILPSEGEDQLKNFISEKKEMWSLVSEKIFSPYKNDCDGCYLAVLDRKT